MFLKHDINQETTSNVNLCLSRMTLFLNAEYYFSICFCVIRGVVSGGAWGVTPPPLETFV